MSATAPAHPIPITLGRRRRDAFSDGARHFWRYLRLHPAALAAFAIMGVELLVTIFAPVIAPYDPEDANPLAVLEAPSQAHLMGTDDSGLDVFSRIVYAGRIDLTIAVAGVGLGMLIGIPAGALVGYYRGVAPDLFMRLMEFLQSFPIFITAMALVAVTGNRIENIIYVMAFLNLPIFVRLVRGEVLSLRGEEYVEAALCSGNSKLRLVLRHVLPNSISSSLVQASVSMGVAILLTAGLSFIGAGVQSPTPEWGVMMSSGARNMILGYWWVSLFPGIAIGIVVWSLAVIGDSLSDLLDPARRA